MVYTEYGTLPADLTNAHVWIASASGIHAGAIGAESAAAASACGRGSGGGSGDGVRGCGDGGSGGRQHSAAKFQSEAQVHPRDGVAIVVKERQTWQRVAVCHVDIQTILQVGRAYGVWMAASAM